MTYKRIMVKLSGELFAREGGFGLNHDSLTGVAKSIKEVTDAGIEVVVVVGGGNIWRFRDTQDSGIERTSSDAIGMLATIMNGVGLQSALESIGQFTRVCSAIDVPQLAEPYLRRRAIRHLEKARVVICAGEQEIHTSLQIVRLPLGLQSLAVMCYSRQQTSTEYTIKIQTSMTMLKNMKISPTKTV